MIRVQFKTDRTEGHTFRCSRVHARVHMRIGYMTTVQHFVLGGSICIFSLWNSSSTEYDAFYTCTYVCTYVCAFTCDTFAFTRQSPCSVNVLFTFSVSDLDMKEGPVCCVPVVCMYTCMCSTFTDPLWTLTDNLSLPFWSCLLGANSWLWSEYMMNYHFPHSQGPVNGCCAGVGVRACVALLLPQLWIL